MIILKNKSQRKFFSGRKYLNYFHMKKFILFFAVASLITSCGGNKADKTSNSEEAIEVIEDEVISIPDDDETPAVQEALLQEQSEEEEGIFRPPFKVTIVNQGINGGWEEKDTYVFNILKNGRLSGSTTYERRDSRFGGPWEKLGDTNEFGGKWSTSSITMGDGLLDVYAIDKSDSGTTIYLPATCDYIWMCDGAWLECENWNTNKAMKVTSVEKL